MSDTSNGQVTITNKDIYLELRKVSEAVAVMLPQGVKIEDHEKRIRHVEAALPYEGEKRIRGLEKWKYAIPATAVTAVGGVVAAIWGARRG